MAFLPGRLTGAFSGAVDGELALGPVFFVARLLFPLNQLS
jgi:hypothetical protein